MNHANSSPRLHFASQLPAVLLTGLTLLLAGAAATAADRGTAYPSAVETADGRILLVSGQGDARQIVRLDPKWLEARQASDDFSLSERLRGWTVTSDKHGQPAGVAVVAHPQQAGQLVLRLQPSAAGHAAAQWNFPAGQQGKLTIRLQLPPGRSGATLSLTDHFSLPADRAAHRHAVFSIRLRASEDAEDGSKDGSKDGPNDVSNGLTDEFKEVAIVLKPGVWREFSIAWLADSKSAQLLVDNRPVGSPRRNRESAFGLNYLRLEATSDQDRSGGVEPHVARLDDGRLWMLIRTKNGYLYESHSADDGMHWTDPQPTPFISSDSPVWVLRLGDGRRVVFLNSCQRYDDPRSYAIGGREVLHAAISDNRGLRWHGFREVLQER